MMRTMVARGAVLGAVFGVLLPFGILLWTMLVESLPGPRHEAVWLALTRIFAAGYPTVLAVDALAPSLQQSRSGAVLYALLLTAVVVNWTIVGGIAGCALGAVRRLGRRGDR